MSIEISGTLAQPNNPVIAYDNLTKSATVVVSSEVTNFEGTNTQNGLTYNFWRPSALPATIEFDIGSATNIDYCGIAEHSLGSSSTIVTVQYFNGSIWVDIDNQTPANDKAILFLFDTVNASRFRLNITAVDSSSTEPDIAVIYFGQRLTVEQRVFGGVIPITLAKISTIRPNISSGGQFLGRSVIRQGLQLTINFKQLTASWVDSNWIAFADDAITNPFFYAWRPTAYTNDVGYFWTTADVNASNTGQADRMETTFNVLGRQ